MPSDMTFFAQPPDDERLSIVVVVHGRAFLAARAWLSSYLSALQCCVCEASCFGADPCPNVVEPPFKALLVER